ncbi:hypothetical protein CC80DRAFT_28033 [Byssothecium circinans]|uniref:DUF7730 domain-containing protein n=1 Tax=Byssothecium circinans TaxID=147558 RepID=A0A6A5U5M7_9PLEO|nr:hypothetical protein CC80DRAFT_28033 [Byssothecium circinans]
MLHAHYRIKPFCMKEYTIHRQKKDFEDALPIPLSERPQIPTLLRRRTIPQKHSRLFSRTPTEIRLVIWEYAIGGQNLHIISKYRRLGHTVCDDQYWDEMRSERPSLRASSYMFTYASLPMTKRPAERSLRSPLVTCRQAYEETVGTPYRSNTFPFWDLRTITSFKASISFESWRSLRSIDIYAMSYRREDDDEAVKARSLLQLDHWRLPCASLKSLSHLKRLNIIVGNISYLDRQYLSGGRPDSHRASLSFLRQLERITASCEIYFSKESESEEGERGLWSLRGLKHAQRKQLGVDLREAGLNLDVTVKDDWAMVG